MLRSKHPGLSGFGEASYDYLGLRLVNPHILAPLARRQSQCPPRKEAKLNVSTDFRHHGLLNKNARPVRGAEIFIGMPLVFL